MVLADSQGRIVLVNAQTEQLFGYRREELIGKQIEKLMSEHFREGHSGLHSAYSKDPCIRPMGIGLELYGMRKDGREFPVEISLSPFESEDGTLVSTAIRDVSERKRIEALRSQLGFEKLLSELSRSFINLSPALVDSEIENGLKHLVEGAGIDRAFLSEMDLATGNLIITKKWERPGIPPNPERIVKLIFPWLFERILKGEITRVSRLEDLPEEASVEYEFMKSAGMKSFLVIPLLIGGNLIGCLALSAFHKHITWDSVLISRFQEVGNVFANALERKRADEKLQAAYTEIAKLNERLEQENIYLQKEVKLEHNHTAVIGQSAAIRSVLKSAEQVASTDAAVLILGETGTGKELIARTIHELSKRKDRPMVKVNCAAIPATLIESELFGREKGSYTGALSREIGRFELADRSTIFLDEIGELPTELQAKLLRVLQDGEFERLGSSKTLRVDVRVMAATNRDLRAAIKEGTFREDLFYRLSVFPIYIPPMRERREDIPMLVQHLLKELCQRMGRAVESIDPATLKSFQEYSWPGNVRELRNVIERHLILNPGPVFRADVRELALTSAPAGQNLEEVERRHMEQVLQNTRWRIRGKGGAAEKLGLKPTTLEARMKKLGIVRPH
ncbi:MAG: sigma 54-interacting transcriptional regulator [Acidobacteria bacterium]|nr:sigma 54-interacting transcriptional regulator [Acidobacteriota bacterium]